MATSLALPLATAAAGSAAQADPLEATGSAGILVAYFSRTGNTRVIARQIRQARDASLLEIRPTDPYPEDYEATVRQAQAEKEAGYRPPLAATVPDLSPYHTVFLGYPVWGMTAPAVIRSFLTAHDLSGRVLIPFLTHGGYGRGDSLEVVAAHAPQARLGRHFEMEDRQERRTLEQVSHWLSPAASR